MLNYNKHKVRLCLLAHLDIVLRLHLIRLIALVDAVVAFCRILTCLLYTSDAADE